MFNVRSVIVRSGPGSLRALGRMLAERFDEDRCLQVAGGLTFTTLLSLVPLITVTLTLISAFPVFKDLTEQFHDFVMANMVPESVDTVAAYADQFAENAGRLTAVGIVFLGVTAVMLLFTIENAFNQIWRVTQRRPLLARVLVYWVLLTVGPVLIGASLSLTSWLISLSLGWVSDIPGMAVLPLKIAPVLLTSTAFAMVYFTLPNRRIHKRDAFVGGLAAGVGFEAMKSGFGFYIAHFPTYKLVYGTFAAVPIFLMWIYLSWSILIAGAVLVAVVPEWRAGAWRAKAVPGSDFFAALALLRVLRTAHRSGDVASIGSLCLAAGLAAHRAERLLDAMATAKWVARSGAVGWVESRDATEIRLADVYHLFVFTPPAAAATGGGIDELARTLAERIEVTLGMTLEEYLLATPPHAGSAPPAQQRSA